jgi:hypothetical protein
VLRGERRALLGESECRMKNEGASWRERAPREERGCRIQREGIAWKDRAPCGMIGRRMENKEAGCRLEEGRRMKRGRCVE